MSIEKEKTTLQGLSAPCPTCGDEPRVGECTTCGRKASDRHIGSLLADKYRVDALIGSGGMGNVYRGEHVELGEPVAIKFLLGHWASMPSLRARFRREAVALARLRHPGIITVLDFGEHKDELYMVMELVRGKELADLVEDGGPLPLFRLGVLFDQILQVIEAAHSVGIIHRDLKPGNVMLLDAGDRTERIKVLDFGLAYMASEEGNVRLTESGMVHGSPHFMSPEQCRGREVDGATDVYAVGVMMFYATTGRLPIGNETAHVAEILAQQMFVDAPRLSDVTPPGTVSPGLDALVASALSKNPQDRPTAASMRDQLGAIVRGTDAHSLAERAAEDRARALGLSRSERVLTEAGTMRPPGHGDDSPDGPRHAIVLWYADKQKAKALSNLLAVNRLSATVWTSPAAPPSEVDGERVDVVVVASEPDGAVRTRTLRMTPGHSRTTILAIEAIDHAQLAALIRAGASDASMADEPNDVFLRKVKRLIRRGR